MVGKSQMVELSTVIVFIYFVGLIALLVCALVAYAVSVWSGIKLTNYLKQHYPKVKRWSLSNVSDTLKPAIMAGHAGSLLMIFLTLGSRKRVDAWFSYFMDVEAIGKTNNVARQLYQRQAKSLSLWSKLLSIFVLAVAALWLTTLAFL